MKLAYNLYFTVLIVLFCARFSYADVNPVKRNHKLNRNYEIGHTGKSGLFTYSTKGLYHMMRKNRDKNYVIYRIPEKINSKKMNPDYFEIQKTNWKGYRKKTNVVYMVPVNFRGRVE